MLGGISDKKRKKISIMKKCFIGNGGFMVHCNKDCEKCKQLNVKVDDKGYPWGYECMKYGDSVFREKFRDTKEFIDNKDTMMIDNR